MWLSHYQIFRHYFIARHFETVVNFIFLFGLAVLSFALEVMTQFHADINTLALYLGDFALVLALFPFFA